MRILLLLTLLAALVAPAGCASSASTPEPASVSPLLLDFREKLDDDPTQCAHAWQQVGMHAYTRETNGIQSLDLCAVLQCVKCGQERHDCRRRGR